MLELKHRINNALVRLDVRAASSVVYVRPDGLCTGGAPTSPQIGSREHYFHFLIGYLLPLVDSVGATRREIRVLDCGPLMTPILETTLTALGIPHQLEAPSSTSRHLYLPMWEHDLDRKRLGRAADRVMDACRSQACHGPGCETGDNLVLWRSEPTHFYLSGAAEFSGYGTSRRSISNLAAITQYLSQTGTSHSSYQPGEHALGCQIRAFRRAKAVFGVRGAEWANMVWCAPGRTSALVVHPGEPNGMLDRILSEYAFNHHLAVTDEAHPAFDPEMVRQFFLCEAYSPGRKPG